MVRSKLLVASMVFLSVSIAASQSTEYYCSDLCAKEVERISGNQRDCKEFFQEAESGAAQHLDTVPKKYEYACMTRLEFANACYCLEPRKERGFIDVGKGDDKITARETQAPREFADAPEIITETKTTTTTVIMTTAASTSPSKPNDPAVCDNPTICDETINPCGGPNSRCYCAKTKEGTNICLIETECRGLQLCSSSSTCPTGQRCFANTCCGTGVCLVPATNEQCNVATP